MDTLLWRQNLLKTGGPWSIKFCPLSKNGILMGIDCETNEDMI